MPASPFYSSSFPIRARSNDGLIVSVVPCVTSFELRPRLRRSASFPGFVLQLHRGRTPPRSCLEPAQHHDRRIARFYTPDERNMIRSKDSVSWQRLRRFRYRFPNEGTRSRTISRQFESTRINFCRITASRLKGFE